MKDVLSGKFERVWDVGYSQRVDQFSGGSIDLMERAGLECFNVLKHIHKPNQPILVLIGKGNNGGDGAVLARHALRLCQEVYICKVFEDETDYSTMLVRQLDKIRHIRTFSYKQGRLVHLKIQKPIVVDAIFGLGFSGDSKILKPLFEEVQQLTPSNIIAIDIPSGINANQNWQNAAVLEADHTVTFGGLKPAHILSPNRSLCGEVNVKDIGFKKLDEQELIVRYLKEKPEKLSEMSRETHKHMRGKVAVLSGQMPGASTLSAAAALRSGAGWVGLSHDKHTIYEITCIAADNQRSLEKTLLGFDAAILGPGWLNIPDHFYFNVLKNFSDNGGFVVFDAAAIMGLQKSGLKFDPLKTVLTPHPGEWKKARLPDFTGVESVAPIQKFCKDKGVSVIHKSPTPVVFSPGYSPVVCDFLPPMLAKAGSGDVLTGIIASLGLATDARTASIKGLSVLADTCHYQKRDPASVIASDLISSIGL